MLAQTLINATVKTEFDGWRVNVFAHPGFDVRFTALWYQCFILLLGYSMRVKEGKGWLWK